MKLSHDMIDTMRDANGAGIAANQIGVPHRMFVIEIKDNPRYPYKPKVPLTVVINPQIEFLSDETFVSNEGCLSVPQIRANVNRKYDHLDGILFPHRVTDMQSFCSWQTFQDFQQKEYAAEVEQLVAKWGA